VRIRPIKDEDLELLYEWQSDPQTRRYSHNSDVPTYIEHTAWVKKRIHDSNVFTEIVLHATTPVGVIRLDPVYKTSTAFLVSIYISPEFYRLGIGKAALENVFRLMPNAELRAEIYDDNIASKVLFTSKGFESQGNMLYVKKPKIEAR
jgi:RimJ/RimL family protein N-acetyltransferase